MLLEQFVGQLRRDLAAAAEGGSPEVVEAAVRLARLLEPAVRLVLLDAIGAAVAEVNGALAGRTDALGALVTADLRLRGRDPDLVLDITSLGGSAAEEEKTSSAGSSTQGQMFEVEDDGTVSRVTLRLPEGLKSMIDSAADVAGTSLNAYIARTMADALRGRAQAPPGVPGAGSPRSTSGARVRGWVR